MLSKTLVLYVFHELNERALEFFKRAIYKDVGVDFLVIQNSLDPRIDIVQFPDNVQRLKRENLGYDFGAWSAGLFFNDNYKHYSHFLFVNSSVTGPFGSMPWVDVFLDGLRDGVKLHGPSINCQDRSGRPYVHVQSYLFCMDQETLAYLLECEIFTEKKYTTSLNETIDTRELRMSKEVLDKGWNISCRMPIYAGIDFRNRTLPIALGDVMYPYYEGKCWTREQLIFIKGNR